MEEKWMVAAKRADFYGIGSRFSIDPLTARLIRNRDIVGDDAVRKYLYGGLDDLYDPELLMGMKEAADILLDAVRKKTRIRVIGDYDIDGIMSSYILLTALKEMGADADVRIPERIRDGYGLNENLVRQAAQDGRQLLLTCDNGIAAAEQIALAGQMGLQTIVTDHHEVPYLEKEDKSREYLLPPADAVIDPKQPGCGYPFKGLCGAGLAYKLICFLHKRLGRTPEESEKYLQYAAIATVGDVCELKDENRILVKEGLKRLRRTENPGLRELILQNGLEMEKTDVYHIGFVLGPCLNASGRLDTARRALDMLLARDQTEAARLAGDLIALNASRKDMTARGEAEAIRLVEESELGNDRVLVVFLPEVHESIAGIIAGRLKEHFYKPSFVITRAEEGAKGSGRSIEAYSMYEELIKCRDILNKFGGHPMAAGISLDEERIPEFRKKINEVCTLTEKEMQPSITVDAAMPVSYISEKLIREMEILRPYGPGNPSPLFAEADLEGTGLRVFGKNRNVAKLKVKEKEGGRVDAVYFGDADAFSCFVEEHPRFSAVYYPSLDTWQGRNQIQIVIRSYR